MKKRLIVFFALAILVFPSICSAMPPRRGPYMSGFLGVSLPVDMDVTSTQYGPGAQTYNDSVEFDPSIYIGGSGGFDFGYIRIEGELSYKNGEMSSITEKTSQTRYANVDGSVGAFAIMCNVFLDLRNTSPVTPYIGGGVGFATLYLSDTFGTDTNTGYRTRVYESDGDTVFAYQVGAGFAIDLTEMLSLDISYRYFGTAKANFNNNAYMTTELEFESHNASVGLRVKF